MVPAGLMPHGADQTVRPGGRRRRRSRRRHHHRARGRVGRADRLADRRLRLLRGHHVSTSSTARDPGAGRSRRLRRRGPHRGVRPRRAAATVPHVTAVRGRRPARRPRRHPRGRRADVASPSTPASSCTTSAPTRCCSASSPSSGSRRRSRRCRCPSATTAPGWSGPARSAGAASSRPRAPPHQPALPADARRDPPLPPQARTGSARRRAASSTEPVDDHRCASSCARAASRRTSPGTSWSPLVAAVWSCDPDVALDYPARYLFTFLEHHGMLGVFGSPTWRTVTGGSHEYVRRLAAAPRRRPHRHQGHLRPRDRRRRRGDRRQRRGHDVRRRRRRHAPRPGPGHARRAHLGTARGPRRDAVLPQHRAAAHRHLAAARDPHTLGVVELPAPGRRRRPARSPSPTTSPGSSGSTPIPTTW